MNSDAFMTADEMVVECDAGLEQDVEQKAGVVDESMSGTRKVANMLTTKD